MYLAPRLPFGWLDVPPGVNRLLGLQWLTDLFVVGQASFRLDSYVSEFFHSFYRIKPSSSLLDSARHANRP